MKRPVLVVGSIPRIIVPIARSLHRRGVVVDIAHSAETPRIPSRAIRESREITAPHVDPAKFVAELSHFIVERGHDMLIPADDWMLRAVSDYYDDFAPLLEVACPPPPITRSVLDKSATLEVARRCGIPVPRTHLASSSSELRKFSGKLPFPWVVKPACKETRKEEAKTHILSSDHEVTTHFSDGQIFSPPMLVQEYCGGEGVGVEILLHHGECLAAFQHRRAKEDPESGGVSVTAIAEPVNESLFAMSLALLRALQWDGVAMVEYRVNADGRAVLMEVNGRYWGTVSLPIGAGMDFPFFAWQLSHGERPEIPKTYPVGVKWRWTTGYCQRIFGLCSAACSSPGARRVLRTDLSQFLEDFSPSVSDATFEFWDPAPSIFALLPLLRSFVPRTIRGLPRLAAALRPRA